MAQYLDNIAEKGVSMRVIKMQVNAKLLCPMDAEVAPEKYQVVTECLQDVLKDSCFHLQELKVLELESESAPVRIAGTGEVPTYRSNPAHDQGMAYRARSRRQ